MEGRGRKSAASLTVLAGGVIEKLEAPKSLTKAQDEIWRSTVSAMPSDWWNASNAPLLLEYVRAVDMVNLLAVQIEAAKEGGELGEIKELLKLRDMESRRVMSLATKMRLSQQSSYTDKSADTAKRRAGGGRPWESMRD